MALGLLFCVIVAAIVIYLFVQGIRYVRPNLLVSRPEVGYTENQTGGFLDPMIGTLLVAVLAMAIAAPVGIAIAVWLSEYARPTGLARVAESTIEMFAGAPSIVLALFGTLLIITRPLAYFENHEFRMKLAFMALAAANMLVFQLITTRSMAQWDARPPFGLFSGEGELT